MGPVVITSDVVSSVFASRECGLLLGDAREVLRTMADDSVDCTVTSPPYYSGRRHVGDTVHEIGSERTVEEYVEALVSVGRELYRVTRPTGSYWLNLDDKCERKEWLGIPWRVAFAMREIGWKVRSEVIWHKPEHVPHAAKDRLTPAHELLFHFVKSKDAYYDMDAIRKPSSPPILGKNGVVKTAGGVSGVRYRHQILASVALTEREKRTAFDALDSAVQKVKSGLLPGFRMRIRGTQRPTHGNASARTGKAKELETRGFAILTHHPRGSVPTDVWTIQIDDSIFPENHYAVFPEALVELPIRATCPRGGTVLDPFVGSGTTAIVALRLGRKAIGIDASADCLEFTKKRILEVSGQPATPRQAPLNHTVKVSHGRMR
jgi:site-specific DNA-methyltransferase (adenine-specific)